MVHGGEIYGGRKIEYDFSVSINPLGMPAEAESALRDSISRVGQYPDPDCGSLRSALEEFAGVPKAQILCGNGASELIEAAVRALRPRQILLTAPSFSGYRHAAEGAGAGIAYHVLRREEGFMLTERYLEDLAQKPGMAILCTPANPVGNLIGPDLLMRIFERCERQGTWLLVDECFLGFVGDEAKRTMRARLARQKASRLLVLDAFTKRFAMPGLRLGYLMGPDAAVMEKIKKQQPEWSVSVPAQAAGRAALRAAGTETAGKEDSEGYMARARALIFRERRRMVRALEGLGCKVFPGEANFVFFSSETDLQEQLMRRGILIRSCDNYPGLEKGDYRIAVLRSEQNAVLLHALEEILREPSQRLP